MKLSDVYEQRPQQFLTEIHPLAESELDRRIYCAGFEVEAWRCSGFATHLVEWLPDFALKEDELRVHHGNMYIRLQEAAVRIYSSGKYQKRGEIGEIALHAICREYFKTIPVAPRVFYLTASNDVVKSFDLVHVRTVDSKAELWLGEAKFYEDSVAATRAAIASIKEHIDHRFLRTEKLILGPQVSRFHENYEEIRALLSSQKSLDELFDRAVFPVLIAAESLSTKKAARIEDSYKVSLEHELSRISQMITESGLVEQIKVVLIYLPLAAKKQLAEEFDRRLKGLQP
jgi:hypothetical protein